jgi:TIR domain
MAEDAVRVFISYSHKDEDLRDKLNAHLSILCWEEVISSWYDRQVSAGMEWDHKIKAELEASDIILLLVSPDFMASKYCREIEIPIALRRHEAQQACVIPIILRPFDWVSAPFAKLQAFPKDAKPVTTWANQDEAFVSIAQGIRAAAQQIQVYRKQQAEQKQLIRSQYLQKVEEVLSDGVISIVERDTLDELRMTLGLTPEEAADIESHAYEPFSRYEESLNKYNQTLLRLIEKGYYPFSEEIKNDLADRQRDLGLKPEDAERVSQPILEQAESDYRTKLNRLTKEKKQPAQPQNEQPPPAAQLLDDRPKTSPIPQANEPIFNHAPPPKVTVESSRGASENTRSEPGVQSTLHQDVTVLNLMNQLFEALSSPSADIGIQHFEAIAHQSLFPDGQIDPGFRKNCFNVAISRLNLYKHPIEVIKRDLTGRTRIGSRGSKENGKEMKYTVARKDNLGGLEGNIRIFFPEDGSPAKISGFNF